MLKVQCTRTTPKLSGVIETTDGVDTLEWFLTMLPSWKAFLLKILYLQEFVFTVTMENEKCKFKDKLLTMTAYKEWVCQYPKADIISALCQFCTNSINIGNRG